MGQEGLPIFAVYLVSLIYKGQHEELLIGVTILLSMPGCLQTTIYLTYKDKYPLSLRN